MKTIKRYPNRKLYDTEESKYITLEEIAEYVRNGGEVQVLDSRTGQDITSVTLTQVLLGEEKRRHGGVPLRRLLSLLQSGSEFIEKKLGNPVSLLLDEAEKTVHRIVHSEASEEIREIIMTTQKAYEDVQKRVDEKLQVVLAALKNLSPIQREIAKLREEVAEIRARLASLEKSIREKNSRDAN